MKTPVCTRPASTVYRLEGYVSDYLQGVVDQWLIPAPASNPGMLRLTGDSVVADEIELSTFNSVVGLHSRSGRWVTYNTPMDGIRKAGAHDIVFQAREGTPELNCCSVNGPRGLGMISDWALMRDGDGLMLNWFGPGKIVTVLDGTEIELRQVTEYPRKGKVILEVTPGEVTPRRRKEFGLALRVPYWSRKTRVRVNGVGVRGVLPGRYLVLRRRWRRGDTVEIDLDFSLHYWAGERECAGKTSIYRGPILLTYGRRLNAMDPDRIPELDAIGLKAKLAAKSGRHHEPYVMLDCTATDGSRLRLCDFGSAGEGGSPYISWLKVRNVAACAFSRKNPLRTARAKPL